MRPFITIIVFFAFAFALLLTPATSAFAAAPPAGEDGATGTSATESGGIGIRLVDIPADAQDDPRAHSYVVDNLPPGTTITRRIEIENNSAEPQTIHLYAGAAHITGGAFVGASRTAPNDLARWTTLTQPSVVLPAGGSAEVPMIIAVPSDAAEGEQYGAVWAEVRRVHEVESGIASASRVGIRLYISVGAGNGPAAEMSITALTASRDTEGAPLVTATVSNTGGRALDVTGELILGEGPSGLSAGPFSTTAATTLAPGDTGDVVVTLGSDLPRGPWQAQLTLESGTLSREMSAQVTFPEAGASTPVSVSQTGLPFRAAVISAAVLIAALTALLLWRRRRGTPSSS